MLEVLLEKLIDRFYEEKVYYASEVVKEMDLEELQKYVNSMLIGKYVLVIEPVMRKFEDIEFMDYKMQIQQVHEGN